MAKGIERMETSSPTEVLPSAQRARVLAAVASLLLAVALCAIVVLQLSKPEHFGTSQEVQIGNEKTIFSLAAAAAGGKPAEAAAAAGNAGANETTNVDTETPEQQGHQLRIAFVMIIVGLMVALVIHKTKPCVQQKEQYTSLSAHP